MAATACLFNLSKNEIGQKLHPKILGQIVKVDLDAMETFTQYHQVLKNRAGSDLNFYHNDKIFLRRPNTIAPNLP